MAEHTPKCPQCEALISALKVYADRSNWEDIVGPYGDSKSRCDAAWMDSEGWELAESVVELFEKGKYDLVEKYVAAFRRGEV